mgnify:CR=1 FL=1
MEKQKSRTQVINRQKIIDAATRVFAKYGFNGTTLDQIAIMASMSKPNLLYYFKTKRTLYRTVLEDTLNQWLGCLKEWQVEGSARQTISNYIDKKFEFSRDHAFGSRVFVNEILEGAPNLKYLLGEDLKLFVSQNILTIKGWIKSGEIEPIEPIHLIFMIWAVTQHYADFSTQIETLTGKTLADKDFYQEAKKNITQMILRGVLK